MLQQQPALKFDIATLIKIKILHRKPGWQESVPQICFVFLVFVDLSAVIFYAYQNGMPSFSKAK